jgi:hypothetical protein
MDDFENDALPAARRRLNVARPLALEGMAWLKEAWRLFRLAAIPWMGMTALVFLTLWLVIGYTHRAVAEILSPFIVAGFMSAGRAALQGEPVTFLHLGAGFRRGAVALAGVGGLYLAGTLLVDFVARQVSGSGIEQLMELARQDPASIDPEQARALLDQVLPGALTAMLLLTPLLMATWFAPALILFDGFGALNSLWWSLWACVVNWRPLALLVAVYAPLGVLAIMIPFGLGLLVSLPLFMLATYLAYRAIFVPVVTA